MGRRAPAGAQRRRLRYQYREPPDDAPGGVLELRVSLGDPARIVQAVLKAASDRVGYPLIARPEYEVV